MVDKGNIWWCQITGNPVGTDTRLIGNPCVCQGCRAGRRIEALETKIFQAYQVIAGALNELDWFETDEGQRTLDYFSGDDFDEEFLPWPKSLPTKEARVCEGQDE